MNIWNIWRLSTVLVLSPCLSVFSLSSHASFNQTVSETIELSDEMMSGVTGSGNVDVEMADYKLGGTTAKATIANKSLVPINYEMAVIASNGRVTESITTGIVDPGQAVVVLGNPTSGGMENRNIQVRTFLDDALIRDLLDGGPLQAELSTIAGY